VAFQTHHHWKYHYLNNISIVSTVSYLYVDINLPPLKIPSSHLALL
jgi:hypothetical protein